MADFNQGSLDRLLQKVANPQKANIPTAQEGREAVSSTMDLEGAIDKRRRDQQEEARKLKQEIAKAAAQAKVSAIVADKTLSPQEKAQQAALPIYQMEPSPGTAEGAMKLIAPPKPTATNYKMAPAQPELIQAATEQGIQVPEGATVGQVMDMMGLGIRKELATARTSMAETAKGGLKSKVILDAANDLDEQKWHGTIANQVTAKNRIKQLDGLFKLGDKQGLTPQNLTEITSGLAVIATGSSRPAEETIKRLTPATVQARGQNFVQWITSNPDPKEYKDFLKRWRQERDYDNKVMGDMIQKEKLRRAAGKLYIQETHPDEFKALLKSNGLSLEDVQAVAQHGVDVTGEESAPDQIDAIAQALGLKKVQ